MRRKKHKNILVIWLGENKVVLLFLLLLLTKQAQMEPVQEGVQANASV